MSLYSEERSGVINRYVAYKIVGLDEITKQVPSEKKTTED